MRKLIITMLCMLALASMLGLAACAPSGDSGSASPAGDEGTSTQPADTGNSQASEPGTAPISETDPVIPEKTETGKMLATGTVVTTTYEERANSLETPVPGFAGDSTMLTLLVLDRPIMVTTEKGGSEYYGTASTISLPNDELFRRFNGQQITIAVDKWGTSPSDTTGFLYDVAVDFASDGLALVEPAQ